MILRWSNRDSRVSGQPSRVVSTAQETHVEIQYCKVVKARRILEPSRCDTWKKTIIRPVYDCLRVETKGTVKIWALKAYGAGHDCIDVSVPPYLLICLASGRDDVRCRCCSRESD